LVALSGQAPKPRRLRADGAGLDGERAYRAIIRVAAMRARVAAMRAVIGNRR
jgi:hypothetical protein